VIRCHPIRGRQAVLLKNSATFTNPEILVIEWISSELGYLFTNPNRGPENRCVWAMDEDVLVSMLRDINSIRFY
jgi:hypothetical protein